MKILRRKKAFTLVEIMIVVLIIGILLAIAVPNFMHARDTSRANACVNNLREISDAKEEWAMDTKATDSATPKTASLTGAGHYLKSMPLEPAGYKYSVLAVNTPPTCSSGLPTHVLPDQPGS